MPDNYTRPAVPKPLFDRWSNLAALLGYGLRGARLRFLSALLDYAEANPEFFRKR